MLLLLTIFLFIFFSLVMIILHLVRPRFNVQGFLAVLAVLVGWILVFLARSDITKLIPLLQWQPDSLFNLSPSLVIDGNSWYFALALASLAFSVVISSITQLGQNPLTDQITSQKQIPLVEEPVSSTDSIPLIQPSLITGDQLTPGWLLWASILTITSLGLLAVTAGNLLTLLLAWTALDIIELVILLGQMMRSRTRERIILAFSARMAGICIVLTAGVMLGSRGASLSFDSISHPVSTLLVIAAGLRLGVLPLHLPFTTGLPINRHLGTILRLVPAGSSYILLVRLSSVGVTESVIPYLLGFTVLAGVYAAVNWLRSKDELAGRLYWLLGTSSLVVTAATLHQPAACLAWSITSLLSGGLIFSMSFRHKNLLPVALLGILNLSALPFTPTWQGTTLYQFSSAFGLNLTGFAVISFFLLFIQAFLLAGFARHTLRGNVQNREILSGHIERWVWFLYPLGLIFIAISHLLISGLLYPNIYNVTLSGWVMGPVVLIFAGIILYLAWHYPQLSHPALDSNIRSAWDRLLSLNWLYRFLWRLFHSLSRLFALVSTILEGDGGLLWALVLFGLIFVFLQR